MNTSMTINATAAWLWGLYLALADEEGVDLNELQGTTQNDIVKEYLSRGTYIFAPEPSKRLIVDMIAYGINHVPKWNPINVCSYHLQEAGATPVQEIAYALATAIDVLDAVRDSGKVERQPDARGRGTNLVLRQRRRALHRRDRQDANLHRDVGRDLSHPLRRGGPVAAPISLRRAGELTRTHRTAAREQRAAHRPRDARRDAVRRRARPRRSNCPRGTRRWDCRDHGISSGAFACSRSSPTRATCWSTPTSSRDPTSWRPRSTNSPSAAQSELDDVLALGGAFNAIDELKSRLVASQAARVARIESGEQIVVGVNRFTETAESPLTSGESLEAIMTVDPDVERELIDDVRGVARQSRDEARRASSARRTSPGGAELRRQRQHHGAHVSRSPRRAGRPASGPTRCATSSASIARPPACAGGAGGRGDDSPNSWRDRAPCTNDGARRLKLLVAKPGLDGHSNGAEQIAVAARDAGFEVVYQGIRLSPEEIVAAARDEDVDIVGISILSGSHLALVPRVLEGLRDAGVDAKVVVGGIVPDEDAADAARPRGGGGLHAQGLLARGDHGRPLDVGRSRLVKDRAVGDWRRDRR